MILNYEELNGCFLVFLNGELDHHNAEEVRVKIDDYIDRFDVTNLILDFRGVTFMDSSGIGVVIGRYKKLNLKKGHMAVTSVNNSIKRVFELSNLFKIIKLYSNVDEAVKAL